MKQFYTRLKDKAVLVKGYEVNPDFFVYKSSNTWFVVDKSTGMSVSKNFTKKQAVSDFYVPTRQDAIQKIKNGKNYEKLKEDFYVLIKKAIQTIK